MGYLWKLSNVDQVSFYQNASPQDPKTNAGEGAVSVPVGPKWFFNILSKMVPLFE